MRQNRQTYGVVVRRSRFHSEAESLPPSGDICKSETGGLLRRYRDVVTDEMQEGHSKVLRTALFRVNWFSCDFSAVQVIENWRREWD